MASFLYLWTESGDFQRSTDEEKYLHLYYRDGRLRAGDELLMVNGKLLVGLTHKEAVAILRSTTGLIQLLVASMVSTLPPSSCVNLYNTNNNSCLLLQRGSDMGFKRFPSTSLPDLVSTCNLSSLLLKTASSPKHHTFTSLHNPDQVCPLLRTTLLSENCDFSFYFPH